MKSHQGCRVRSSQQWISWSNQVQTRGFLCFRGVPQFWRRDWTQVQIRGQPEVMGWALSSLFLIICPLSSLPPLPLFLSSPSLAPLFLLLPLSPPPLLYPLFFISCFNAPRLFAIPLLWSVQHVLDEIRIVYLSCWYRSCPNQSAWKWVKLSIKHNSKYCAISGWNNF